MVCCLCPCLIVVSVLKRGNIWAQKLLLFVFSGSEAPTFWSNWQNNFLYPNIKTIYVVSQTWKRLSSEHHLFLSCKWTGVFWSEMLVLLKGEVFKNRITKKSSCLLLKLWSLRWNLQMVWFRTLKTSSRVKTRHFMTSFTESVTNKCRIYKNRYHCNENV